MEYFRSEYITPNIVRIIDMTNVAMYLVIGKERACLLDTGSGIGNIAKYVKTLTDKEVFVVLTHGHVDHIGGASLFEKVHINFEDAKVYQEHSNIEYIKKMVGSSLQLEKLEIQEGYQTIYQKPYLPLHDKQEFDLGNTTIKTIHVPGHTKGMMMVLIVEQKIMLYGDGCGVSVMLFDDNSSCVSEYRNSLLSLKKNYTGTYNRIIRNHGKFESELSILNNVIDCCDDILADQDDKQPIKLFGESGYYYAKKVNIQRVRFDDKEGNILYRYDKSY